MERVEVTPGTGDSGSPGTGTGTAVDNDGTRRKSRGRAPAAANDGLQSEPAVAEDSKAPVAKTTAARDAVTLFGPATPAAYDGDRKGDGNTRTVGHSSDHDGIKSSSNISTTPKVMLVRRRRVYAKNEKGILTVSQRLLMRDGGDGSY
ncbi:hypothetical protein CMQ_8124 [Grosmannia clavigera kw1407]|uniref:Uncharacterized protein n=1 Tax=Grosmannia clavigera (strain kw1407 / UAMH 11150) TaxID=655863 RepID=F0XKY2_GROCL|nr:uncharacterized protein CMQ_8124 [Grosmannia clavigera kw1407]EFX01658.1 hypothetical protein CMQ_8124 [Grosmannia clavigera kw1407]